MKKEEKELLRHLAAVGRVAMLGAALTAASFIVINLSTACFDYLSETSNPLLSNPNIKYAHIASTILVYLGYTRPAITKLLIDKYSNKNT